MHQGMASAWVATALLIVASSQQSPSADEDSFAMGDDSVVTMLQIRGRHVLADMLQQEATLDGAFTKPLDNSTTQYESLESMVQARRTSETAHAVALQHFYSTGSADDVLEETAKPLVITPTFSPEVAAFLKGPAATISRQANFVDKAVEPEVMGSKAVMAAPVVMGSPSPAGSPAEVFGLATPAALAATPEPAALAKAGGAPGGTFSSEVEAFLKGPPATISRQEFSQLLQPEVYQPPATIEDTAQPLATVPTGPAATISRQASFFSEVVKPAQVSFAYEVVKPAVNVRVDMNRSASVLTSLKSGTLVHGIPYGDWIRLVNQSGYMLLQNSIDGTLLRLVPEDVTSPKLPSMLLNGVPATGGAAFGENGQAQDHSTPQEMSASLRSETFDLLKRPLTALGSLLSRKHGSLAVNHHQRLFELLDKDGSGSISSAELDSGVINNLIQDINTSKELRSEVRTQQSQTVNTNEASPEG